MVPLVPTLTEHQKASARRPAVAATFATQKAGSHLLRWQRLYLGADPAVPHAAALAPDGALLRIRNFAGTLQAARIPAPGIGANFATWATITPGLLVGSTPAIAARVGEALMAYSTGLSLVVRTSTDNGTSWSAPTTVATEATNIDRIAAAYQPNGDVCLFYILTGSTTLKRLRRTAGVWAGSGTTWTRAGSVSQVTGVAAVHDGSDFALLITGLAVTTNHKRVFAAQMGDLALPANAWSALVSVAEADADSSVSFNSPALVHLGSGALRGAFTLSEAGSVAYSRTMETFTPAGSSPIQTWSEPQPHEATSGVGPALASLGNTVFLCQANAVWQATLGATADVSTRVVSLKIRTGPSSSRCTLELDNADGALAALPNLAFPAILTGATLTISAGYASGAAGAPEYASVQSFTVERVSYTAAGGRRTVTVEATGPWEQLARWRSPQAWQVSTGALDRGSIVTRIANRAGLRATQAGSPYGPSTEWTAYSPSFVVQPGESGAAALNRLLAVVNDGLRSEAGFLEITGLASPLYADVVRALGPLSWWRLNETAGTLAQDYGSAVNNGTYTNGPVLGGPGPLTNQPTAAPTFDGIDDHVLVPDPPSLRLSAAVTVAALIKTTDNLAGIYEKTSAGNTNASVLLFIDGGAPKFRCVKAPALYDAYWLGNVLDDAWHLLVGTYDGANVRLYVDGDLKMTTPGPASLDAPAGDVVLATAGNTLFRLSGQLAEVAVWNRALTASEIAALQLARNPAVYAYGPGAHPVSSLKLADEPPPVNWLRLQGPDRYADQVDAGDVYQHGPRLETRRNLDASTDQRATAAAAAPLRRAAWATPAGELVAPWNAGAQLFDVVSVEDPHVIGAQPRLFRVIGLALDYDRGPKGARYDATLTLADP